MRDEDKSREELIAELQALRRARQAAPPRDSHALLQAVVEGLPLAIFVKDRHSRYLLANSVTARFAGKSVAEMVGNDDRACFSPETAAEFMAVDRRIMETGVPETFEAEGTSAAGIRRMFRTTKAPLREADGSVVGIIGISRDITEGKQQEERLRRAQEFLTRLLENIPANVYVNGRDGERQLVNQAWEKCFDLPRAQVLGRRREDVLPADLASRFRATDQEVIASGSTVVLDEFVTIGGRPRWFHTVKFPLRDAAGAVEAVGGISFDVTERRQAEDALRSQAERLQALSRRLVQVQEEERYHLARELHDEIGQVLTSLKLMLSTVALGPKLAEARQLIEEALTRVRDLSFDLRPALLDHLGLLPALRRLIERYTATTAVRVNFKHAGLEERFEREVETAAYRVVQEALTNVARHAGTTEVAVRVWVDAGMLEIQVEDQGAGFDVKTALAAARSSGLPGMRERVHLLGGRLEIEAAPGSGTHLLAVLPAGGGSNHHDHLDPPGR